MVDSDVNHVNPEKKKISKKIIIIICAVIVVVIIGACAYLVVTADTRTYKAAKDYYSSEKYEEALEKFTELGTYEDSEEMVEKCKYALSTDGQFFNTLSKGLMERWKYADDGYVDEYGKEELEMDSTEKVEYTKKCINLELEGLKNFESQTFSDKQLGDTAKSYINLLNDSIKATDYYKIDFAQYSIKWEELYAKRSVFIRDFVENYGLVVDENYQKTLDEFITNASVVDEQQAMEQAITDMMSKFILTPTTDEWGNTKYKLTMENTTEYTFEYFYASMNALDADGNIIGTGNVSQVTNWMPGQKAEVDVWVNVEDVTQIASTTYTAHYQSGNIFE